MEEFRAMPQAELSAGTIDYEDTGGDGPAIVFGHGLLMDDTQWRHVIADLRTDFRCVSPTLPLGAHRQPMRADADLSMRGIAGLLGELMEQLDLKEVTLAMNDWGGPQLLVGSAYDERLARLAICSCEAFDNVPPRGPAQLLPYIARMPGGVAAAMQPFRFDGLRRLPLTWGWMSKRPVPKDVMDRWFAPAIGQPGVRRDLRKYLVGAKQARREMVAVAQELKRFERPALVAWAGDDRMMPKAHGPRLAELLPRGRLEVVEDSYTLIPEDQPATLARHIRELMAR
jgi:pimeloyl-ACP methyl ester carboxylesterase